MTMKIPAIMILIMMMMMMMEAVKETWWRRDLGIPLLSHQYDRVISKSAHCYAPHTTVLDHKNLPPSHYYQGHFYCTPHE